MKFENVLPRLRQIYRYASLGQDPFGFMSLAVLGLARGHPFCSPDLLSYVGRRLFPELIVRPKLLEGFLVALNPSDVTHIVIFDEVILENNYDLGLVPFTPDEIIDCGGHIGLFSLLAAKKYPNVKLTVFEPNPENVRYIRRQNDLNCLDLNIVEAAVSTRDGNALFKGGTSFSGHLADPLTNSDSESQHSYTVTIIDLLRILMTRRPQKLLLKLDIEGEEANVIPRLFDAIPATSAIFFETHHGEPGWERANQQFNEHGFTVQRRRQWEHCIDGFALRKQS